MAAIRGSNQSPTITQRYLNTAGYAGDPTSGAVVSTANVSGSIVQSYGGMVGGILTLSESGAAALSDPINGPLLFAGDYQYVQFSPVSTNTCVQGQIVFWWVANTADLLSGNFIVTPDFAAPQGQIAGIALCNTGKGNFWFIQTAGIAEVKFRTLGLTNTSPQVADLIYVDQAPSQFADVLPSNESLTAGFLRLILGRAWYRPPVAGAISPVFLGIGGPQYFPGA